MKSGVIVFRLLPEHGHHNATFYFSKQLMEKGYRIIYATTEKMREHVEANGFEYYEVPFGDDPSSVGKFENKWKMLLRGLSKRKTIRSNRKIAGLVMRNHNYLKKVQTDLKADLLIADRAYGSLVLNAIELNMKVCHIETMVPTNKIKGLPPLGSYLIPKHNFLSDLFSEWQWFLLILEKRINAWIYGSMKDSLSHLAQKASYPIDKIDVHRFQNEGYEAIKELIVSPQEIDFPHTPLPNQLYVGPSINVNRNEPVFSHHFVNPFKGHSKPLVYCAMGSLSWRYKGIEKFYVTLCKIFKDRPEYNFITTIYDDGLRKKLETAQLPNARVFKHVPQLTLLKEASVMINHGGMNSITECILLAVPMLVYPGTSCLDQPGNSARVVYHGIGLRGRLRNESAGRMISKIDTLINDPVYRKNIIALKDKIRTQKNYLKGPEVIESFLKAKAHESQEVD